MRRIALGLIAATFLSGNAMACMPRDTTEALNIIGLKSTLMVSALTCNQRSQYDRFMNRFHPYILREQHMLDAYFRQKHGRAFHHYEDSYVTDLANVQSTAGIRQGTNFCESSQRLYDQVLNLDTQSELTRFANQRPARQPIVMLSCGIVETSSFRRVQRFVPRS